ncbi:MAG: hypothetical protein ISQ11_14420 [Planctomycetes bacterium]|nr:hypothetical protein [Planctomycetota bacterium]
MTNTILIALPARSIVALALLLTPAALSQNTVFSDATGSVQLSGPTLDEPFHMPTMTDVSTLDVVVLEDWHVDSVGGTTRQKLIDIHVDDWWAGVEIRVPVRLVVPLTGTVSGFVIGGGDTVGDQQLFVSDGTALAIDGGVGVVTPMITGLGNYPDLPSEFVLRGRFIETLDYRYTEFFLWSSIMMRSITAAFDDSLFEPGPVIAHGNSKNGIAPLISSIHDVRITAVRSTHAFTALTPVRAGDPDAVAEVVAADEEFDLAVAAGLPAGDQPWDHYLKGFRSGAEFRAAVRAYGWTEAEMRAAFDGVADDLYVSENWEQLTDRGVEIFSLPGSHDWVVHDVHDTSTVLPGLRTYIVPNGGHARGGHPEAPRSSVNRAFFAEQLFGAEGGLETPEISAVVNGAELDVTVTFPEGGEPEESRVFWMYDRGPDGSSWYLYDLFPAENWAEMVGSGSTWTVSILLEPGRTSIDLITTHTATVDGHTLPISAPYTRVTLDGTGPCFDVVSFCDQGAGAPQLELMPPQAASSLHFVLTDAAPGATVALVGGQRGLPMGVPAGSLCLGGGRRVIAHGQAGPGGAALLPWHPGAAGWTALSSGQFAVQALSQGLAPSLSNALAIQTCP